MKSIYDMLKDHPSDKYDATRAREWRKKNPEKAKAQDKKKREKQKAKRNLYSRKHYEKNKDSQEFKDKRNKRTLRYYYNNKAKAMARNKVNKAVRDKKITKPKNCVVCFEEKKLQAHHEDYSKPLDVMWLCLECHRIIENYKLHIKAKDNLDDSI